MLKRMDIEFDEDFIAALRIYGLTAYEAKAYYVLLTMEEATAGAVARRSGVPQQRIYDTLSSLERKGFIQSRNTTPKLYSPLGVKRALNSRIRQLRAEFEAREQELLEMIPILVEKAPFPSGDRSSKSHVWILESENSIVGRIIEMISSAQHEVRLAGDRPLFTLNCKGVFQRYLNKGVTLYALGTFERVCRKEIESVGGKIKEAKVDYHYILIIDNLKLLLVYFDEDGVPSALYTENEDIVNPHLHYFEILWNKGKS